MGLEIQERLGLLFTEFKGKHPVMAGFFIFVAVYKVSHPAEHRLPFFFIYRYVIR